MRIEKLIACEVAGGAWFTDLHAIKRGAVQDGFIWRGEPVTPGFTAIRMPSWGVSVLLQLEDGQIAHGDCAMVAFPGFGRDLVLPPSTLVSLINQWVKPKLEGRFISTFREVAQEVDLMKVDGQKLHSSIRYGVTQALLDTVARGKKMTMAEVIAEEYRTNLADRPIPIFTQCGEDRYTGVIKNILKRVPIFPHGSIKNLEIFRTLPDYIRWIKDRIAEFGEETYKPTLHFDIYGTMGEEYSYNLSKMVGHMEMLAEEASPYSLQIEDPVDMGNRESQIKMMSDLRKALRERHIDVKLVVDEWAPTIEDQQAFIAEEAGDIYQIKAPDMGGLNNSIEAVLNCKKNGVGAYLGGTCAETDRSVQVSAHVAIATEPHQILARPGYGIDEAFMITNNEMQRILAILRSRKER